MGFDPISMMAFATMIGGAGMSAAGQNAAGKAESAAGRYNAKVSEMNAAAERDKAAAEAEDYRLANSRKLAASIAARGASGVAIGSGTPLQVTEDVVRQIELGASRIGHEGGVKANAYENQAKLDRAGAKNARSAGRIMAGATLLSGASGALQSKRFQF